MGTALSGDAELIRITLVDYFSGAVLVDNIVQPDVPMLHLNTRYSGVTWTDIKNARRQGSILQGKAGARQAIWNYVGPNTVVVGHGVDNDLRALRWLHMPVVDSFITELSCVQLKEAEKTQPKDVEEERLKEAEARGETIFTLQQLTDLSLDKGLAPAETEEKPRVRKPGNLSLKTLAKRYLDRDIQTKGKAGHDSLEDAIAARDLVHCKVLELMEG